MKKMSPMKFLQDADEHFPGHRSVTFHSEREGIRKILGDLEADVMETLWTVGSASVREVRNHLADDRPWLIRPS
ncbi:MAG: BlaI/MecI/CopY family transcriptional regulator [candidate division Zixibacteria bacterium]|nr:BlaI/MecI/CopY family transcriptional regulator [candidate division Zixibacteria bacterium]